MGILLLLLIPIFIFLALAIGAIIYRAACAVAGMIVGTRSSRKDYSQKIPSQRDYYQNVAVPAGNADSNPFSAPSSYKPPVRQSNEELSPKFGTAMLIVFLTGISGTFVTLILGVAAGAALSAANPETFFVAEIFLRIIGLIIQFALMTTFGKLILNTTWGRAALVTVFYYLIALAIGLFFGAVAMVIFILAGSN